MLNELVSRALDETLYKDPDDVAEWILCQLGWADRSALLSEVLPTAVGVVFSRRRLRESMQPEYEAEFDEAGCIEDEDEDEAPRPASTSFRVARIRNNWARKLQTPLSVDGQWKRLANCTREDLLKVAVSLRNKADAMNQQADWYSNLASHLRDGETVSVLAEEPLTLAS